VTTKHYQITKADAGPNYLEKVKGGSGFAASGHFVVAVELADGTRHLINDVDYEVQSSGALSISNGGTTLRIYGAWVSVEEIPYTVPKPPQIHTA
jgi:hypothetical protein